MASGGKEAPPRHLLVGFPTYVGQSTTTRYHKLTFLTGFVDTRPFLLAMSIGTLCRRGLEYDNAFTWSVRTRGSCRDGRNSGRRI
jgi:hypothetical protein